MTYSWKSSSILLLCVLLLAGCSGRGAKERSSSSMGGADVNGIFQSTEVPQSNDVHSVQQVENRSDSRAPHSVSCAGAIGEKRASMLVDQCRMISPATHPPCNIQNSCEDIRAEILRGCRYAGKRAPRDICRLSQ
jgi:hypothetical protein